MRPIQDRDVDYILTIAKNLEIIAASCITFDKSGGEVSADVCRAGIRGIDDAITLVLFAKRLHMLIHPEISRPIVH
ncbi:MAG: hypothetical protein V7708_00810 [Oceanicoccus sp.]